MHVYGLKFEILISLKKWNFSNNQSDGEIKKSRDILELCAVSAGS